eukprot:TRINITY_DN7584_c0_g1_i3.p4 TRINITY_DN7584_c0_g1~~TRINITY_DN7584_c0_g1_i3.p4  ORF type:complete len:132 (+),score=32.73 TRINITY_DN7584_c0_g1_i3:357-752(+)
MWIYAPPTGAQLGFAAIKKFMGSQDLSFIHFVDPNNEETLQEFYLVFPKHQLEKKYGGYLQDFTTYWPPADTLKYFEYNPFEQEIQQEAMEQELNNKKSEKDEKKSSRDGGLCGFCASKQDKNSKCVCIIF